MIEIALSKTFRYIHEPLRAGDETLPMLGNVDLVEELQSRITHSLGGTFLLTGFRGVGKSTVILQALDKLGTGKDGADVVVPVVLSVARSTDVDRLLFAIVRRLFESLSDGGHLSRLPVDLQRSLLLSYMRTSLAFKQTQSEALERVRGMESGPVKVWKLPVLKFTASTKRTRSLATEAQFLAYSETDVEHDVMRIVSLIHSRGLLTRRSSGRLRRLWPWPRRRPERLRLVVVLDEVDKLTDQESGLLAMDRILSGIKNVLTMPGIHFVLAAGPDLHDKAIMDAARGNSIYESVFSWQMYVSCNWDAVDRLLDAVVVDPAADPKGLALLRNYLCFKARGIPRRLLQEFNSFVSWQEQGPVAHIRDADLDRITFYAELEEMVSEHLNREVGGRLLNVPIDHDRRRLGAYYVIDWILESRGEPFSPSDLFRADGTSGLDPLLRVSRPGVSRLLEHLTNKDMLKKVRKAGPMATMLGNAEQSQQDVYVLSARVRCLLVEFAESSETERANLNLVGSAAEAGVPRDLGLVAGRYRLLEVIGRGSQGTVYLGRDDLLNREVAVKTLARFEPHDDLARNRMQREARIAGRLSHPNVVQTYDVVTLPDGGVAIVMERLTGTSLDSVVHDAGALPAVQVARIGVTLANVLQYLSEQHIARIDLKPSNVVMEPNRGPVIIDFGIAKEMNTTTFTDDQVMVGTPMYMSPEQMRSGPVDSRADIYSLGLVLIFCLTGQAPLAEETIAAVLHRQLNDDIDTSAVPVSNEFRAVLARATRKSPDDRYASAAEMAAELVKTPELNDPTTSDADDLPR